LAMRTLVPECPCESCLGLTPSKRAFACCCCRLRSTWSRLQYHASRRAPARAATCGMACRRDRSLDRRPVGREPANVGIVTVPSLLLGARLGRLASQLGNVIVSSQPVDRSGEVGGFQHIAHNLGASLGTAPICGVVTEMLATQLLQGIKESPEVSDAVEQAANAHLEAGVEFVRLSSRSPPQACSGSAPRSVSDARRSSRRTTAASTHPADGPGDRRVLTRARVMPFHAGSAIITLNGPGERDTGGHVPGPAEEAR
jgi:hypothetical protein